MARPILDEDRIHPGIRGRISNYKQAIVQEVMAAVRDNDVVVVGMAINPFPRKARAALEQAGVPFKYIGYGSYFSRWRDRSVLKMWTGWPTFPMVFVKGTLVGGAGDVKALIDSGELKRLLGR